ncbi:MAG TPA: type III secretion system gatekeeper subunit SctW [Rhabdochlamydiaceae bacterium]|nr:type III secretion system gatekeeper subunit SctW [Rhabdochlamydiaceae bacterium]
MSDDHIVSQGIQRTQQQKTAQQQAAVRMSQYAIAQEAAQIGFDEWGDLNAWNPLALSRNFQNLEKRVREKAKPEETKQEQVDEEQEVNAVEELQSVSEAYQRRNPELQARTLLALRVRITARDSVEDIIRKLRAAYTDLALVDEALDFLLETADPSMKAVLEQAKAELNRLYEREIKSGRNIGTQARNFSTQGLGSPTALRDLYRNITGTQRDAHTLYQELSNQFAFDKMKTVIDFVLHSLGADIKAKGPSIPREELQKYLAETRNMQAILGVYRYFFSRMRLIASSFDRQGLLLPPRITFESLSRIFMRFIQERYPSVDKALLLSQQLGIAGEELAQLIIYLQLRDAMRQVAPRLFRDEKQRQELLMCFIETLEDLEEKLEEEEEEENEKKKKKK